MKGFKRLKAPAFERVERGPRVASLDAASALKLFGYSPAEYEAVDVGPPRADREWKPGTRVYECRRKSRSMN